MKTELSPQRVRIVHEHIAQDLICTECGYNLRTQPLDGRCPECATPIPEVLAEGHARQLKGQQYLELWWGVLGLYLFLWTCFGLGWLILLYRGQLWRPLETLTELSVGLTMLLSFLTGTVHLGMMVSHTWRGRWQSAGWLLLIGPLNPIVAARVFGLF